MSAGGLEYRPDIDGLRALAVLSVVLYHFGWPGLGGGFLGVDIFFVISGYLITRLIAKEIRETGRFSFGRFYLRRARRLFPALAVTLALSCVAALVILSPLHLESFGWELGTATLSVSNIHFYKERGYFDTDALYKPLLHTWSLGVEEQFYLIWPPLVWMAARWRPAVGLLLLAVGGGASLIAAELVTNRDQVFYLPWFRVFEFAAGAALVRLDDFALPSRKVQVGLLGAGLMAMLLPIHFYDAEMWLPGLLTVFPVAGAALTIYAGRAPGLGLVLSNPVSVWIGRISYSLYLVHWPLVVFYSLGDRTGPLTPGEQIMLPCVAIAVAATMYRFVEMPFRTARLGRSNPRFLAGVTATMVALVAVGGALPLTNGIPQRLSPELARLVMSTEREILLRECQYQSQFIDEDFLARFRHCLDKYGRPVVIFGDSHAHDLVNALSSAGKRAHVVALWGGNCTLLDLKKNCVVRKLSDFIAEHGRDIDTLVYTQNGAALLSGDADEALDLGLVATVRDRLEDIAKSGVPLVWVGPQEEPGSDVQRAAALMTEPHGENHLKDNLLTIFDLDAAIGDMVAASQSSFAYVSKIKTLGPMTNERFIIDGEYTYVDKGHWAAKGEEVFGRELLAGSPVLYSIMNP